MATLTIRLQDAHRDRLAAMAARRGVSLNKLVEELSVRALAEHDTEMRFRLRAARGDKGHGMKLLDELDRRHAHGPREVLSERPPVDDRFKGKTAS